MGLASPALPPLVAGECSVYSVRRLHCRAHNFCLVAAWGDAFEGYADRHAPVDAKHESSSKSLQAGLLQALAGNGRPSSARHSIAPDTRRTGCH